MKIIVWKDVFDVDIIVDVFLKVIYLNEPCGGGAGNKG